LQLNALPRYNFITNNILRADINCGLSFGYFEYLIVREPFERIL